MKIASDICVAVDLDFYIESKNVYVEVKGYETDRDRSKWLQFPEKLCIIKEKEIKQIREGCFVGL